MAAAEALLARHEIGDDELDGLFDSKRRAHGVRLETGVDDGALNGGLSGGDVVGIWGDGSEVCGALLVDALLKYSGSMAAVVDTTGNFDVVGLYTTILERVRKDLTAKGREEDVAAKILDQVKIMRVFDFVGMREAVGEVRDDLEGRKRETREKESVREKPRPSTPKRPTPEPLTPEPLPKRTVVADSEDEDDDEEMLFDTAAPAEETISVPEPSELNLQPQVSTVEADEVRETQQEQAPGKVKFILIDNIAQVLNPLLKKDYIQANALASTFLQTLNHLTRTHTLYTILSNPATPLRSSSPVRQPQGPLAPEQHKQQPPPPPSIFASNIVVPSLMGVLARYVDVSLLVSQLPKKKMDAKVYYRDGNGNAGGGGMKKLRGVELVKVLEVMWDRWEGRVGGWGVL